MANDLAKLVVRLEAEASKLHKELEKSQKETAKWQGKVSKSVSTVKKAFAGLAVGAGLAILTRKVVDATATQQRALGQLRQGLETTANAAGLSFEQIVKHAQDLQKVTIFGDEQIIEAQSQLVTFTNIAGDQFRQATELALDLSTRMDQDLKSSIVLVGKALNAPKANLSALTRVGIQFTEEQQNMIKALEESGDLLGAQKIILGELETQFGGSARAARQDFGGALQGLKNAANDLLEADGGGLRDVQESIEDVTSLLQDPAVIDGVQKFANAIVTSFGFAIEKVAQLATAVTRLGERFAELIHGPGGSLESFDRAIANIEEEMASLGPGGANEFWADGTRAARLAELEAELELLRQRRQTLVELGGFGGGFNLPTGGAGAAGGGSGGVIGGGEGGEVGTGATTVSQYDQLMAKMREQVALFGATTEAAKIRYQVENGLIEGLTPLQGERLIAMAEELDALDAQAEAVKELESALNNYLTDTERQMEALTQDAILFSEALRNASDPEQIARLEEGLRRVGDEMGRVMSGGSDTPDDETGDPFDAWQAGLTDLGSAFETLVSDLVRGVDDWEQQFLKAIAAITIKLAALKALESAGYSAGGGGGSIGDAFASAIAGSFDGGGFTWAGPRSGGLDGKGGRLAMLHPNEHVTDLTRQRLPAGVVNNITVNEMTSRHQSRATGTQVGGAAMQALRRGGRLYS